jgi:hypothetical protein
MKTKALIEHEKKMKEVAEEMKRATGYRLKDLRRQYRKLEKERATYVRYTKGSD